MRRPKYKTGQRVVLNSPPYVRGAVVRVLEVNFNCYLVSVPGLGQVSVFPSEIRCGVRPQRVDAGPKTL